MASIKEQEISQRKEMANLTEQETVQIKTRFQEFLKLAEQGDAMAQYIVAATSLTAIGADYLSAIGIDKNDSQAIKWLEKSAEQGVAQAQFFLAMQLMDETVKQDNVQGIKWLEKAAEQGDAPAQSVLGKYYYDGFLVKQDDILAFQWIEKAAIQGFAEAQVRLALCYFEGKGVEKSVAIAFDWIEKASEQPDCYEPKISSKLYGDIGIKFFIGDDIEKDAIKALHCFIKDLSYSEKGTGDYYLKIVLIILNSFKLSEQEKIIHRLADIWELPHDVFVENITKYLLENSSYEFKSSLPNYIDSQYENLYKSAFSYFTTELNNAGEFDNNYVDPETNLSLPNSFKELPPTSQLAKENYSDITLAFMKNNELNRAEEFIETAFKNPKGMEEQIKKMSLFSIQQEKMLEEKNKQLEEKNKELNNLIAMFAHNFLGTLQCIRSNAEHDNNAKIHLKTVKMMSGALTAFSIISADDDKLIEQLKQDNKGEINLQQNLANNLALAISQLLSQTNKDKIINIYLNYLQKTAQIKPETNGEDLRFNDDDWEKWQALQHQWEDEFNRSFSETVDLSRLKIWIETNFFPIQIIGFNDYNIRFKEFGITDSIFLVIFMEVLVNALKYSDVSQNQPLTIMLCKQDQHYQLTCENPSAHETNRGSHKGTDFLKSIAHKVNGQFITESTEQSFKSTFIIPAELLE